MCALERSAAGRYYVHAVSPGYFATLGMRVIAGATFTGNERADGPRVAIVSESGARRLFPSRPAVGQKFRLGNATGPEAEIVGVIADTRFRNLTADLGASRAEPDVFFPYAQRPDRAVQVTVRTAGPAPTAQMLQQAVSSIDPALPVYGVEPLSLRARRQTANGRAAARSRCGWRSAPTAVSSCASWSATAWRSSPPGS
ncbi:MAG: ABC transporter permease [Acidobacteriota bacterium]|nr:ABC transporter permease [Acidobacteriota bacterium]